MGQSPSRADDNSNRVESLRRFFMKLGLSDKTSARMIEWRRKAAEESDPAIKDPPET